MVNSYWTSANTKENTAITVGYGVMKRAVQLHREGHKGAELVKQLRVNTKCSLKIAAGAVNAIRNK